MELSGRFLSRPVRVHWQGWESTTQQLQNCGWGIAADWDIQRDEYTLAMHNADLKLFAISDSLHIDSMQAKDERYSSDYYLFDNAVFTVRYVSPKLICRQIHTSADFSKFQLIDATPQWTTTPIRDMQDFNIFAPMSRKTDEILVDLTNWGVVEHLDQIKKLQSEKQKEIRSRILNDTGIAAAKQVVAQLVHYREAA